MNKMQEEKGITLMALVVTIIVLLILAGISISMLTGDNGIIQKALEAKELTESKQKEEEEALAQMEEYIAQYTQEDYVPKVKDETPGVLEGNGTQNTPYEIESIEDLVAFSNEVNSGNDFSGEYVSLGVSLDFNSDNSYENPETTEFGDINGNGQTESLKTEVTTGKGFEPIGNYNIDAIPFTGTFMGNENFIRNLYMDIQKTEGETDAGLFGYNTGTIQDIYVINCNLKVQDYVVMVGGISGVNDGTILRSSVSGNLEAYATGIDDSITYTGGITGLCTLVGTSTLVSDCYNTANIKVTCDVDLDTEEGERLFRACGGGIVGSIQCKSALISNCYNKGNLVANASEAYTLGGIVSLSGGLSSQGGEEFFQYVGGNIKNCYNIGKMEGEGIYGNVGGAVGMVDGGTTIDYVYALDEYDLIGEELLQENYDALGNGVILEDYPNSITNCEAKTEQELKSSAILSLLGTGFKADKGINGGYPILSWQ